MILASLWHKHFQTNDKIMKRLMRRVRAFVRREWFLLVLVLVILFILSLYSALQVL